MPTFTVGKGLLESAPTTVPVIVPFWACAGETPRARTKSRATAFVKTFAKTDAKRDCMVRDLVMPNLMLGQTGMGRARRLRD